MSPSPAAALDSPAAGAPPPPLAVELLRLALRPGVERPDPAWGQLRALLAGRPVPDPTRADWDAIARAARHAEVAVLAAAAHPELARRLELAVRRQTLVDMNLELALDRVVRALERARLAALPEAFALVKGAATAPLLYARTLERFRRDIDLLVSPAVFPDVVRALVADGWREDVGAADRALGPSRARAWPLVLDLPIGALGCDLHQRLFDHGQFRVDPRAVLAAARSGVAPLPVASPEDLLLITAAHLAKGGFQEPLKAWVDLARLAALPGLDRAALGARARAWGVRAATWGALEVAARWLDAPAARALQHSVQPAGSARAALRWLLAGDGAHPLRHDLSRHAASALVGPLTCDDPRALAAWTAERLGRRVGARARRDPR